MSKRGSKKTIAKRVTRPAPTQFKLNERKQRKKLEDKTPSYNDAYQSDDDLDPKIVKILSDALVNNIHMFNVQVVGYGLNNTQWLSKDNLSDHQLLVEEYLQSRAQNKADLSKFNMLLPETEAEFISITNTVDDIGYPENFTYIDKNIYSDDIPRPCTPLHFCECVGKCENNCVCVRESYYDANGKVQVDRHVPLMECGPKCKCGDNCSTRVVQWGSKTKFEIYRSLFKGWGVRAAQFIGKGTFISEYVGEVITFEEAEKRGSEDTAAGLTYLFDLDMAYTYGASADFSIDAKTYGNISHFFNHSCDPNMEIRQVFIEHRDPRLHRLAFFSTRDIDLGEELTFGYSPSASDEGTVSFDCRCGSNICRGRINF